MTFGKLEGMVFTSRKASLGARKNVYSAMVLSLVLSVLLQGVSESWALSRTPLSRLETSHKISMVGCSV